MSTYKLKTNMDLFKTFNCGQCFRFDTVGDKEYIGVALNRVLHIRQTESGIEFINCSENEYKTIWKEYFALDIDYDMVYETFPKNAVFTCAAEYARGIRVIRQDMFETLITFIISQNNNIPRIKKIIGLLCDNFGKKIEYQGKEYFAFPDLDDLKGLTAEDLSCIKSGFRSKYIVDAVSKIASGEVSLSKLYDMDYESAKEHLKKIKGVGDKVADCVLLFGVGKYEAFPKDVWIKRVMNKLFEGQDGGELFGKYAGIAQQFLFYYGRDNEI